jgi:hypothetical protein
MPHYIDYDHDYDNDSDWYPEFDEDDRNLPV